MAEVQSNADWPKIYRVFARTGQTNWVELNAFDNEADARALMREVLNGGGYEVMIATADAA